MTYRLHHAPDNASLIVRLTLLELGQPFDAVLVDRTRQAQKSPAYLALNPNGLIPVLETDSGPIFETGAILLWLADRHGALMPTPGDPRRGEALKWLFFLSNTLHAGLRMQFYPAAYVGEDAHAQACLRKTNAANLAAHLKKLNTLAQGRDWLLGNDLSVLDLYLAPLLRWCALYPLGDTGWFALPDYPALAAILERLETRGSVKAADQAEGLGPRPFTDPRLATPPEGSAT